MLVLTRKIQQQIHVGNDVVITILQVKGQQVRVGIEAPRQVRVVRGELKSKQEETVQHETTATVVVSGSVEPLPATAVSTNTLSNDTRSSNMPSSSAVSNRDVTSRAMNRDSASGLSRRDARDGIERLASRSFSRPDRLPPQGSTLATMVAARRVAR